MLLLSLGLMRGLSNCRALKRCGVPLTASAALYVMLARIACASMSNQQDTNFTDFLTVQDSSSLPNPNSTATQHAFFLLTKSTSSNQSEISLSNLSLISSFTPTVNLSSATVTTFSPILPANASVTPTMNSSSNPLKTSILLPFKASSKKKNSFHLVDLIGTYELTRKLHQRIENQLPSLPLSYWFNHRNDKNKFYKTKSCAIFPRIYDLEFHNIYWQTLHTTNGTFYIYSAYLDTRNTSTTGPAVRVLVMHDHIEVTRARYCHLWFEERAEPYVARVVNKTYLWRNAWSSKKINGLYPHLLTCLLPPPVQHLVPVSMSLVENICDTAYNHVRVHYDRPALPYQQKQFVVCVKGLDFLYQDVSVRLVEWIEIVRLFGADKIDFYVLQVHHNISKVLEYYKAQHFVSIKPITLPGGSPNVPGLQYMFLRNRKNQAYRMEIIPYTDCLYRNMYKYRWLVAMDVDEVIVPMVDGDWAELMQRIIPLSKEEQVRRRSSYMAHNLYFLDNLSNNSGESAPSFMYMLRQLYHTNIYKDIKSNTKGFHETEHVLGLHNHYPLGCNGEPCSSYTIQKNHARLQHYRPDCRSAYIACNKSMLGYRDPTLRRWSDQLEAAVYRVLTDLNLVSP